MLSAADALQLYDAVRAAALRTPEHADLLDGLHPEQYFTAGTHSAFLTQSDARSWGVALLARLDTAPAIAATAAAALHAPAAERDERLSMAVDVLNTLASGDEPYTMRAFVDANAVALLLELDASCKLPAICFNHNRDGCEQHVLRTMAHLDEQMELATGQGFEAREAAREKLEAAIKVCSTCCEVGTCCCAGKRELFVMWLHPEQASP